MPAGELSSHDVRLLRLRAQGLLPGQAFAGVLDAARGCLCLQAQDVPTARLALRARTEGLTAETAAEEAAAAAVCRCWLMRNTVHLFADEDLAWMRPLLAPTPLKQAERRLGQLGVAEKLPQALRTLRREIAKRPLSRDETRAILERVGIERGDGIDANAPLYWTFHAAALLGVLAMRPALDPSGGFTAAPPDDDPGPDGWGRLARRYLESYGPATVRDFAYWAKITLTDARRAWELVDDAVEVATENGAMTALPSLLEPPATDGPVVRLLGTWDNYMLGHKGRELAVKTGHGERLPLLSGFRCAISDGVVFASWKLVREKGGITVAVEPFGRLPPGSRDALQRETADVGRFLGAEARLQIDRP